MKHPNAIALSIGLMLPILTSGVTPLNAQSNGGPGTAGGAATSRSQIGVQSPAGVVLPNANGTGLGTSQPSYNQSIQGLSRNAQPGSFQVPARTAPTLSTSSSGTTPQTRCAGAAAPTGTTTTSTPGAAADVLAASTGSRPAGLTPVTGTGANCQP